MWLSSPLLSPPRLVAPIWGFAIKFHIWRLTPTSLSTFPASSSMRIPFQRFNSSKPPRAIDTQFQSTVYQGWGDCREEVVDRVDLWDSSPEMDSRGKFRQISSLSTAVFHQWNQSLNLRKAAETTYRQVAAIGHLAANTAMMTALRRPWSIGWWRWWWSSWRSHLFSACS